MFSVENPMTKSCLGLVKIWLWSANRHGMIFSPICTFRCCNLEYWSAQQNCKRKGKPALSHKRYWLVQWWIQDFPDGEQEPQILMQKTFIWQGLWRKLHEIGLGRVRVPSAPLKKSLVLASVCRSFTTHHICIFTVPILGMTGTKGSNGNEKGEQGMLGIKGKKGEKGPTGMKGTCIYYS